MVEVGSNRTTFRCLSLDRGDLPREQTTADRSSVHIRELTREVRKRVVDDQSDTIPTTAGHQFGLNLACDGVVHPRSIGEERPVS